MHNNMCICTCTSVDTDLYRHMYRYVSRYIHIYIYILYIYTCSCALPENPASYSQVQGVGLRVLIGHAESGCAATASSSPRLVGSYYNCCFGYPSSGLEDYVTIRFGTLKRGMA